jgi:hypothetical protein
VKSKTFNKLEKSKPPMKAKELEKQELLNVELDESLLVKIKNKITNKKEIRNLLNDMSLTKLPELNDFRNFSREFNYDISMSIDKPIMPKDIEGGCSDLLSDTDGYEEDEDEDLPNKNNTVQTFLKSKIELNPDLNQKNYNLRLSSTFENNENQQLKSDYFKSIKSERCNTEDIQIKENLNLENDNEILKSNTDLFEVLYGSLKFSTNKFHLLSDQRKIFLSENPGDEEWITVLKPDQTHLILKYLYDEMHSGLTQLSDEFVEDRRKYMNGDHNTYVSVINFYLRKKEELFIWVLSEIMSKLNITQKILDDTFNYYLHIADSNSDLVVKIREAYESLYHAGIK